MLLIVALTVGLRGEGDPIHLLRTARRQVLDTVDKLPRYVCTETVTRFHYEADSSGGREALSAPHARSCDEVAARVRRGQATERLIFADRVRLDVAVSADRSGPDGEMYSWVGADRFSGRDVFDLVPDGALSTGAFSSMLRSIFGGDSALFTYDGDKADAGVTRSEFGFRVARDKSAYFYLFGNGGRARVGYDGTLLVDPNTSGLARLVVRTEPLPAESGACEITRTVDYGSVRLHGTEFLLPSEARVSIIHTDESVAENVITYSNCHEFLGESTLRFDSGPSAAEATPTNSTARPGLELPAGLSVHLVFLNPIDPRTAAAGDPVSAKLKQEIRDGSKILVPAGAPVTARIASIKRVYRAAKEPSLVLAVKLESIEVDGVSYPFGAAFDTGVKRFAKMTGPLTVRIEISPDQLSQQPGTGTFEFWNTNPDAIVRSGLESDWLTVAH